MMKKLRCKYYNKRITTRDNGNVQPHNQEKIKLNNTIFTWSVLLMALKWYCSIWFFLGYEIEIKANKIITKSYTHFLNKNPIIFAEPKYF